MFVKDGIYDKSVTWGVIKEYKKNVLGLTKNLFVV